MLNHVLTIEREKEVVGERYVGDLGFDRLIWDPISSIGAHA